MSANTKKHPAFDLLEVQPEVDFDFRQYLKLNPVKSGTVLPDLLQMRLAGAKRTGSNEQPYAHNSALPYLNKVLVVYFYSSAWQQASLEHLKQLNAIRHELRYNDAELFVINADHDASALQQLLWEHNLLLTAHHDPENKIAKIFGVYDEQSPAWSNYAGVNINTPVPAVFVLDHFLRVIYDDANLDIRSQLSSDQLVTTVYQENHYHSRRSA